MPECRYGSATGLAQRQRHELIALFDGGRRHAGVHLAPNGDILVDRHGDALQGANSQRLAGLQGTAEIVGLIAEFAANGLHALLAFFADAVAAEVFAEGLAGRGDTDLGGTGHVVEGNHRKPLKNVFASLFSYPAPRMSITANGIPLKIVGCVKRIDGEIDGEMVGFARSQQAHNATPRSWAIRATHHSAGTFVLHPPYDEYSGRKDFSFLRAKRLRYFPIHDRMSADDPGFDGHDGRLCKGRLLIFYARVISRVTG